MFLRTRKECGLLSRETVQGESPSCIFLETNTLSCVPQGNERGIELLQTTIGNFPVSAPDPEGFVEFRKNTRGNNIGMDALKKVMKVLNASACCFICILAASRYLEQTTIMQALKEFI